VFSGWLRALSTNGGWDGFLSLSGPGYGVVANNGTLSGFAWGSDVVGWVDFSGAVAPMDCTLDGVTVPNGGSHTFYVSRTTTAGQLCASVAQNRACADGVLSGDSTYQYATCSCAAAYFCSGSTIQYADTACNVSTVTSCTSPGRCTAGSSSCAYDAVSADFRAQPQIVRAGGTSRLYWNVSNAQSCTVSGNGQSWSMLSSMPDGVQTNPILTRTTYMLDCVAYPGQSDFHASTDVLLEPQYQEQ
jgi:hypothetical protein